MVSVKKDKMNHKQANCIIKVDKSIVHIIQFILDNFKYYLSPLASCGGNNNTDTSYLMLYVRDLRELDKFLAHVQSHLDDVKVEYEKDRIFRISWPSRLNKDFIIEP